MIWRFCRCFPGGCWGKAVLGGELKEQQSARELEGGWLLCGRCL